MYIKRSNQIYHFPFLKQTYEQDGIETFKKIKNKIKNNETTPFDIFDFVWLPKYGKIERNQLPRPIEVVDCELFSQSTC